MNGYRNDIYSGSVCHPEFGVHRHGGDGGVIIDEEHHMRVRRYEIEHRTVAALRLRRDRAVQRSADRQLRTLVRWGARQIARRFGADWVQMGTVEVVYGETADDFIRNTVTARLDARLMQIDDDWRRWVARGPGGQTRIDTTANAIEIMVPE